MYSTKCQYFTLGSIYQVQVSLSQHCLLSFTLRWTHRLPWGKGFLDTEYRTTTPRNRWGFVWSHKPYHCRYLYSFDFPMILFLSRSKGYWKHLSASLISFCLKPINEENSETTEKRELNYFKELSRLSMSRIHNTMHRIAYAFIPNFFKISFCSSFFTDKEHY